MNESSGRSLPRPALVTAAVVVVVGLALAVVLVVRAATGSDTRPGSTFPTLLSDAAHTTSLRVPYGVVTVRTTDLLDEVRVDDRTVEAPDGGSIVGVSARPDAAQRLPQPRLENRYPEPRVTLTLLAGGRSYSVPPATPSGDDELLRRPTSWSAYVAVAGRPDDVRVMIGFDGVDQTVDPATGTRRSGRAAALYDVPIGLASTRRTTRTCAAPSAITAGFAVRRFGRLVDCEVLVVGRLPYLPGLGWAEAGRSWFAVDAAVAPFLSFNRTASDGRVVAYRPSNDVTQGLSATVDGRPSTGVAFGLDAEGPLLDRIGQRGRLVVFDVPAAPAPRRFALTASFPFTLRTGTSPDNPVAGPAVRATWTIALR